MSDVYERWIARRRAVGTPDGFADRVMEGIPVAPWLDRPWVRAAVWVAAFFALTARMLVAGTIYLSS